MQHCLCRNYSVEMVCYIAISILAYSQLFIQTKHCLARLTICWNALQKVPAEYKYDPLGITAKHSLWIEGRNGVHFDITILVTESEMK